MSIRALFDATWDEVYRGAHTYPDSDYLMDQRTIIVNRNVGARITSQLIMMFNTEGHVELITIRYCSAAFVVPALLHTCEQRNRLLKAGIVCKVAFDHGLVTVTYARADWIRKVAVSRV